MVEFVESTHSPKNLLLRAHRRPGLAGKPSQEALEAIRERFSHRHIIELTATVAAYNMVSRFLEALQVHSHDAR